MRPDQLTMYPLRPDWRICTLEGTMRPPNACAVERYTSRGPSSRPPEHTAPLDARHRIAQSAANVRILDTEKALVKGLLALGANDRRADARLAIHLLEARLHEQTAEAPVPGGPGGSPASPDTTTRPARRTSRLERTGTRARQNVLPFGVCGALRPEMGGQLHGG